MPHERAQFHTLENSLFVQADWLKSVFLSFILKQISKVITKQNIFLVSVTLQGAVWKKKNQRSDLVFTGDPRYTNCLVV